MYKDIKTTEHQRDARGQIKMPQAQKKQKSAAGQFISVAVTTLALALVVTGLLLHASIQNNEKNLARINRLENTPIGIHQQQAINPQPNEQAQTEQQINEQNEQIETPTETVAEVQPEVPNIPIVEPQQPQAPILPEAEEITGDCENCENVLNTENLQFFCN